MLLAEVTTESLQIGSILMGLIGGLALFLYGLDQMSDALKLIAGDGMKRMLAKVTTNRFTGAIAGAFVTAVVQSSSVTTVLVVGFVSAGLMSLAQSIGVIIGREHRHDDHGATDRVQAHPLLTGAGSNWILLVFLFKDMKRHDITVT